MVTTEAFTSLEAFVYNHLQMVTLEHINVHVKQFSVCYFTLQSINKMAINL